PSSLTSMSASVRRASFPRPRVATDQAVGSAPAIESRSSGRRARSCASPPSPTNRCTERKVAEISGAIVGIPRSEARPPHPEAATAPGACTYADYLRAGPIAKLSPATAELRRFAVDGGVVLGSCNGFQILCEAGLLPGALIRNSDLAYRCDWVHVRVESERTPFTDDLGDAVLKMPIGNGEGCWVSDPDTLARVV